MITKIDALLSLRTDAEWVLRGDELEWLDVKQTQPTDKEIEAEIVRLVALEPIKKRITELKQLLADSDFKFNVDYDEQNTPEWDDLKTQRQAWRDEIRTLEGGE